MSIVLITGSAGLVGSDAAAFFCERGYAVVGLDNDMRRYFFGEAASTRWQRDRLLSAYSNYVHHDVDVRDRRAVDAIFGEYSSDIALVIHTAAQPSHDWAARDPVTDFTVNANGTLNLLECTRCFCPEAVFIFTSTNKVYGDRPNRLPLIELETRWEIDPSHPYQPGIDESMSVDDARHSLFGASKLAADVLVQEYGRYFGMKTACFRAGCITGPNHSGAELHGFLSYLMKCVVMGARYTVFGYKGKQVRDNIHSYDLVNAFFHFFRAPRPGEVYNIGGGRFSNCSMLEAIAECEDLAGRKLSWRYAESNRIGDHIWWISDVGKFRAHFAEWNLTYDLRGTLLEILERNGSRWTGGVTG
ncbi:MAG: NAD-dependent epimerase/dehydratase family protein [Gemmatimonadetes bacterium]|nr:NAD-dependent epimerase/dehydratase family protein [Gemmatimonadota bacterium]